jgi:hypothetical protein
MHRCRGHETNEKNNFVTGFFGVRKVSLVALLVALRFSFWCLTVRDGAQAEISAMCRSAKFYEGFSYLRSCVLFSTRLVESALEWIKRALLYQLSYAPTANINELLQHPRNR